MPQRRLRTLLGDYPVTAALRRGDVVSSSVALDFADVAVPNTAFRRVVRDLEFDVAELAIVTFLMARAQGVKLTLLPAVVVGRFQHPFIVYDSTRGPLAPADLAGRRVGIRSWTVTTVAWIKAILANDFGVDLDSVRWVTFEDAHVAGWTDPPTVERAARGQDLLGMLRAGEIDAAVFPGPIADPAIRPLIPDPDAAARVWQARYQAIQVNHMVVVKSSLAETDPAAVQAVYRLLLDSRRAAGPPAPGAVDLTPFGIEANRRNLEVAIDTVHAQGLIPRRVTVDELFEGVAGAL